MLYLYKYVYYIIYIYSIPFFSTYYTGLSLFELGVDFAGCSIVQPNLQSHTVLVDEGVQREKKCGKNQPWEFTSG